MKILVNMSVKNVYMTSTVYYRDLSQPDIKSENINQNAFCNNLKAYKNVFCNKTYNKNDSFLENHNIYRGKIPPVTFPSQNFLKLGKHFLYHYDYLKMLQEIEKRKPGQYLLGPGYNNTFECEAQLGITGTCKINENYRDAMIREFREEIGLSFNNIKRIKKIGTVQFYGVNVIPGQYSTIPFFNDHFKDTLKDRRNYKVVALVYGKEKEIIKAMKDTKLPKCWLEGEDISHICAVKVSIVISVLKKLMEPEFICNGNHLKGCKLIHKNRNIII